MVQVDCGLIGGTGVGARLAELGGTLVHVPTKFGLLRGRILEREDVRLFLVQRHSLGHKVPPHFVNYRAMADGLARLGAKFCLASGAVGSLRPEVTPGSFRVCSDFLDLSARNLTLFDRVVRHTDVSGFRKSRARQVLAEAAASDAPTIYANPNGPRFETECEVRLFGSWGADVVGMTAASEALAMREAGIDYACLAIVTNYAAGISPTPLSHLEVVEAMERNGPRAVDILLAAAKKLK